MSIKRVTWVYIAAGSALVGAVAIAPSALAGQRHGSERHIAAAQPVSDKNNSSRVVALAGGQLAAGRNGRGDDNGRNNRNGRGNGNGRGDGNGRGNGNGGGNTGNGNDGQGNGRGNDDRGRGRGHEHDHDGCQYPPTRTPNVGLTVLRVGPGHVHLTGTATVNGCRQSEHTLALYHSLDGQTGWHLETSVTTDRNGAGAFTVGSSPGGYYKVAVAGDDSFLPASSTSVRVG